MAVFIDGCFWHGCPEHGTVPKNNRTWWSAKLEANRRRDEHVVGLLSDAGWVALRFWEHENPMEVCDRITETVEIRRAVVARARSRRSRATEG